MKKNIVLIFSILFVSLLFFNSILAQDFMEDPIDYFEQSINQTIQAPMDNVMSRPYTFPVESSYEDDFQSVLDECSDHRYDSYHNSANTGSSSF